MGLTARQLAKRLTGVTATDMVVLAGLSPHGRSAHDVWLEKMELAAPFVETEATELGTELEPIVIRRAAAKLGLHVQRRDPDDMTISHPSHPRRIATPDAFLQPTAFHAVDSTMQVKVVGVHNAHEWEDDDCPDWVTVQSTWEAHVADVSHVHVAALVGTGIRMSRVVADDDLVGALAEIAERFWTDHVVGKRPPDVDGSEGSSRMLRGLYPKNRVPMVTASEPAEMLAGAYFEAKKRKEAAEEVLELTKQKLVELCGEAEGIKGDGWRLLAQMREETPVSFIKAAYRHYDIRAIKGRAK